MSEIIALTVHIVDVKDNFVHLHRRYLSKFRNFSNELGFIRIEANQTHYASCSATAFNSNGENAFNISSTFSKTLGVDESDSVVISSVSSMPFLKTVLVSPISADDLPIMEDKAETIQSNLLSQIHVIVKHQILTIWISKSVSTQVHIDRLDNNLGYGKLGEHTEVVISSATNACSECPGLKDKRRDKSSTWNIFKNIFSFNKPIDEAPVGEQTIELNFCVEGVFRCILIDDDIFKFGELVQNYPYNAFISNHHLVGEKGKNCSIYKLTHLPYVPSKNTNLVQKENTNIISSQEVFIFLHKISEANIVNEYAYSQINCCPSIFVSKTVFYTLRLKMNSKVKLEAVTYRNESKPTQIDFTVVRRETDETNIVPEIKNMFKAPLVGGVVNNGHLFALDRSCKNVLYLSFNPVNLPFVELNEIDVQTCSFRASPRELGIKLENDDQKSDVTLLPLDFQQKIIRSLKSSLLVRLKLLRPLQDEYLENSYHTILEGNEGTGKSSVVMLLKNELEKKCSYQIFLKILECKTLKGKLISKLEKLLEAALIECLCHEPAILCLDDVDVLIASSKQNAQTQSQLSILSYTNRLSHVIHDLVYKYAKYNVTLMATAKNCSALEARLFQVRGSSLFSDRIVIPAMNLAMRHEYLIQLLSNRPELIYADHLMELVRRTEGYSVQDLSDLVNKLYFEVLKRHVEAQKPDDFVWNVQKEDVDQSLSSTVPLTLIGIDLHKRSSISWKDVGGLETAKNVLTEVLIWPSQFPKIFEQCPLKLQSGVLLYGIPGSGKTLLASAVAAEAGLNFISVKGPELLSKFIGESEEGVRNIFRKAQKAKPCILFFDEFDSLAPRRGNDITGVTDRVVNQLLTELDGVENVCGVWVLAATSRPDLIDPALLRPGRLGTTVHCPLPNEDERHSILEIMSEDLPDTNDKIDWKSVAAATTGYTGADLKAVLYTAASMCDTASLREIEASLMHEYESGISHGKEENVMKIDTACLLSAVEKTSPSLKLEEMQSYRIIYEQFERKDNGIHLLTEQKVALAET